MNFPFVSNLSVHVTRVVAMCVVVSASLLVIGCAVEPPESQMMKVAEMAPESWSATKEGKAGVDRDWVASFKDKQLNKLVVEAIERNPDMRVQVERVYQARRNAYLAGASAKPQLVGEIGANRSKQQFIGFPFGGSQINNGRSADLTVNWELDLWGRVRMGQMAAISDAQAAELDQKAAETALAGEVCKAWFSLGEAWEQLTLAERVVEIRTTSVEAIADRFESNLAGDGGSASQLRLAQTDLATAQAQVAQRKGDVELAERRLEILCGRYPSGALSGCRELTKMPKRPPSGVPSSLLQRRPDIVSAERRFAAAVAREEEARRAIFPIISLTGSAGTASDALEQLLNSNFSTWSIGANVTQNILTGGRVIGERDIRSSKQREELANLQGVVLRAFGEVENALVLENWLDKRVRQTDKAFELARDAAEAANDDFLDGTGDVLTLLQAQSRAVELGSSLLTLKRVQLDNRVDLHLALGGEFRFKGK
jgi:NodT family efflux transporter outer membrane factor (OMF) lipoprotein